MEQVDYKKYGTDVAIDIVKQLITLSSAFIVVTATIMNVFSDRTAEGHGIESFWLAGVSWSFAIVAIASGILALGAIATSTHDEQRFDVDEFYTKWCMRVQQISFVAAFIFFIVFASVNIID